MKVAVFWFRRDLRVIDNVALFKALSNHAQVLPIFIFDDNILAELSKNDARISFIYKTLAQINQLFKKEGSGLKILQGNPETVWQTLVSEYDIEAVYVNKDYEPYAIKRDNSIKKMLEQRNISFNSYKDQVIFEENEIVKNDGLPYTVYTPYSKKWLARYHSCALDSYPSEENLNRLYQFDEYDFPTLHDIGFDLSPIEVPQYNVDPSLVQGYGANRDYPVKQGTSLIGPYLRFGLISIRHVAKVAAAHNEVYLSELIWREFFMQIIFHFPKVIHQSFKSRYDNIEWENNEEQFQLWCEGKTGYPIVDAGMRELNATGYMHNRVRMVVASFLCKHLLIDWRWGEQYFARNLLDYDLSANNGNWQWAAGCGCDAAPYFRVFNPYAQQQKFDPEFEYIKKWVEEYGTTAYPEPIVDHKTARIRAIERYKEGLQ